MNYEGTVAVVSHDRSFIRRVGTKILEINYGQVTVYPGTYDEYVWSLEKGALALRSDPRFFQNEAQSSQKDIAEEPNFNYKERKKILNRKLKQYNKALKDLDANMTDLQKKIIALNSKITTTPASALTPIVTELADSQTKLENLEVEWLTIEEKKDEVVVELRKLTSG